MSAIIKHKPECAHWRIKAGSLPCTCGAENPTMTKHKPDCELLLPSNWPIDHQCDCGADKPTPPAPTYADVLEAREYINNHTVPTYVWMAHTRTILSALDKAQGEVAEAKETLVNHAQISNALRAENARLEGCLEDAERRFSMECDTNVSLIKENAAQAEQIAELEWLVEVYAFMTHYSCPPMYHYAGEELYDTMEAARAAVEGK